MDSLDVSHKDFDVNLKWYFNSFYATKNKSLLRISYILILEKAERKKMRYSRGGKKKK